MGNTLVSINLGNYGSTGNIMREISGLAEKNGYRTIQVYPGTNYNVKRNDSDIVMSPVLLNKVNQKLAYYTGYNGCFAIIETAVLLWKLRRINPDIIHLHNIHDSYINYMMLFKYIRKYDIPVVWTLHDCWSVTGHCAHFIFSKCDKWKNGCHDCEYLSDYPKTIKDRTEFLWKLKKSCFTGLKSLTVVTPSEWLGRIVRESYLSEYEVRVINNGIDLDVFCPSAESCDKRDQKKYLILGVSFGWTYKKGIDIFKRLADDLSDDYEILLVGTDETIEKELPSRIKTVRKTSNRKELANLYTKATVLVNASREENFPTVNIEALACGTPVVTFDTGGSAEMINEKCGISVNKDDYCALLSAIKTVCKSNFSRDECREQAMNYAAENKYKEYLSLYNSILRKNVGGGE